MQDNTNHRQQIQPTQAPPSLLPHVLERIQQAEQAVEAIEHISTALASSDWPVRARALEQLAHVEKETARPWLARALADEHPSVRAWAIHVLALHQEYELIRSALRDLDWQVREAAMLALGIQDESMSTEFTLNAPNDLDVTATQTTQGLSLQRPPHALHAGERSSMKPINPTTMPSLPLHDEPGAFQEAEPHQAKTITMQFPKRDLPQRKRFPRLLGLVAAVLVSAALIAGMVLAYATLNASPAPSHSSPAARPTASIPPACRDVQDQTDETLCTQRKETLLNLTKDFSGHKITFVRAYADISRLMLVYSTTDSPRSDTISFMSVTIQQGIKLGGGGGLQIVYENPEDHLWYYLVSFEMKGVPASTPTLYVKGITDAFSGTETPLGFTIPFHSVAFDPSLKSIPVKQTMTSSNGVTLTLDHLTFTLGGTFLYFKMPQATNPGLYLHALSINGQQVADSTDTTSNMDPLAIQLTLPLLDKPGAWTVQVMVGKSASLPNGAAWIFHFTVAHTTQTQ